MSLPAPLLQALVSTDPSSLPQQHALEAPQRLPRLPTAREKRDPLGFDALREAAIQLAQEASCTHWTDFNLHDPGVTLLEAFSYALSEDIYASRQSVPELLGLLADADAEPAAVSEAALARHALHGPRQALPCRPSTARDYQRWLYDQWPEARHLRIHPMRDRRGRPTGLWQLARQAHQADREDREQAQAQTRAYWAQRNLGEDLLDAQQLLQPRWVRLRCRLRVDGQRDLAELLAELLARCDDYIAARPQRRALKDQPDNRRSGPLMSQGWVSSEELERCQAETLKFNDLALFLRETPGPCSTSTSCAWKKPTHSASSVTGAPSSARPDCHCLSWTHFRTWAACPCAGRVGRCAWPGRPQPAISKAGMSAAKAAMSNCRCSSSGNSLKMCAVRRAAKPCPRSPHSPAKASATRPR